MKYQSTRANTDTATGNVTFAEAVLQGMAPDGGLYMPSGINALPPDVWQLLPDLTLPQQAKIVLGHLLDGAVPDAILTKICNEAFNFDIPLISLTDKLYVLELFHGPSLAFKDFGARFMARVLPYLQQQAKETNTESTASNLPLHIIVATSGDTGGAVAAGFHNVEGTKVSILYPKGMVSSWQERQLTCLGGNINAYRVASDFDGCQALAKAMLTDTNYSKANNLASANSINLARLYPQVVYYVFSSLLLQQATGKKAIFCVPSGNFGNLVAGLIAKQLGAPIKSFIAANNSNAPFMQWAENKGKLPVAPTVATISNAMDVSRPSNVERIEWFYRHKLLKSRKSIIPFSVSDAQTTDAIQALNASYGYVAEPHLAVGYYAATNTETGNNPVVILGTAHPAKFLNVLPTNIAAQVEVPASLSALDGVPMLVIDIDASLDTLKSYF